MFQSSPPLKSIVPTATLAGTPRLSATPAPATTRTPAVVQEPTAIDATAEPPGVPTPPAPEEPAATPSIAGYLPPPTLTAPGAFADGASLGPDPRTAGRKPPSDASAPEPTPEPDSASNLARLIDNGLVALGYVWLCGGAFLLLGAAGVMGWLFYRNRSK